MCNNGIPSSTSGPLFHLLWLLNSTVHPPGPAPNQDDILGEVWTLASKKCSHSSDLPLASHTTLLKALNCLLPSLETEEVTADHWHLRESQMSIWQIRGNQERQLPLSMQGVASHVLLAGAGTAYTRIPVVLGRCPRC